MFQGAWIDYRVIVIRKHLENSVVLKQRGNWKELWIGICCQYANDLRIPCVEVVVQLRVDLLVFVMVGFERHQAQAHDGRHQGVISGISGQIQLETVPETVDAPEIEWSFEFFDHGRPHLDGLLHDVGLVTTRAKLKQLEAIWAVGRNGRDCTSSCRPASVKSFEPGARSYEPAPLGRSLRPKQGCTRQGHEPSGPEQTNNSTFFVDLIPKIANG